MLETECWNDSEDRIDLPKSFQTLYGDDITETVFKKITEEQNCNKMASTVI